MLQLLPPITMHQYVFIPNGLRGREIKMLQFACFSVCMLQMKAGRDAGM